jgi:Icc-related predicted phosphoesterase
MSVFDRRPASDLELFWANPVVYLAQKLWSWRRRNTLAQNSTSPISVVCVSDTHNTQIKLPPGDILIHAGDLTQSGSLAELSRALDWLRSQPHDHKIVIGGNHDLLLDANVLPRNTVDDASFESLNWSGLTYLNNESVTIQLLNRKVKVYGSPWTPRHGNWAFQYPRENDIWHDSVPDDVDILVTHGPPKGHLDLNNLGCAHLLAEVWRTRPLLHVFGHIHAGRGQEWIQYDSFQRAYEAICLRTGGVINLFWATFCYAVGRSRQGSSLLVNAAVVGGFRDELRREAIRVVI